MRHCVQIMRHCAQINHLCLQVSPDSFQDAVSATASLPLVTPRRSLSLQPLPLLSSSEPKPGTVPNVPLDNSSIRGPSLEFLRQRPQPRWHADPTSSGSDLSFRSLSQSRRQTRPGSAPPIRDTAPPLRAPSPAPPPAAPPRFAWSPDCSATSPNQAGTRPGSAPPIRVSAPPLRAPSPAPPPAAPPRFACSPDCSAIPPS